jgi:16S rRNA (uracil1498-N3)-methyltransferase
MHRFYFPSPNIQGNLIIFNGPEWHHSRNVVRNKVKDHVVLFNGKGTEYLTELMESSSREAQLKILSKSQTPRPPYRISLAQALPKSKAMDYIVQKATELGVEEIIPVLSDRSIIKLDEKEKSSKIERWLEISIEAAKQCGLNWLPKITYPKTVKEVTEMRKTYQLGFIGSLQPDSKRLWDYFPEIQGTDKNTIVMIGPEGDFTPAELGLARSAGFNPLSLGPMVLRCDTAAIYAISTISYELSHKRS